MEAADAVIPAVEARAVETVDAGIAVVAVLVRTVGMAAAEI